MVADLERVRLDLERCRMLAEDRAARLHRRHERQVIRHWGLQLEMQDDVNEEEFHRDMARNERDALAERLDECIKIIGNLERDSDRLRTELEQAKQAVGFVHNVPAATENEARRKFLKRWF